MVVVLYLEMGPVQQCWRHRDVAPIGRHSVFVRCSGPYLMPKEICVIVRKHPPRSSRVRRVLEHLRGVDEQCHNEGVLPKILVARHLCRFVPDVVVPEVCSLLSRVVCARK